MDTPYGDVAQGRRLFCPTKTTEVGTDVIFSDGSFRECTVQNLEQDAAFASLAGAAVQRVKFSFLDNRLVGISFQFKNLAARRVVLEALSSKYGKPEPGAGESYGWNHREQTLAVIRDPHGGLEVLLINNAYNVQTTRLTNQFVRELDAQERARQEHARTRRKRDI